MDVLEAFRGRPQGFARCDLEYLCLELITGEIPSSGTGSWMEGCTPAALIEILWNVGFLRAEVGRDGHVRRTGNGVYLGAHQANRINVAATQRFQVHPMFREYLDLGKV
jgi:hypothetical protein